MIENYSVQENALDVLSSHKAAVIKNQCETLYTNGDGLHNKLNDLKIFIQTQNNKPEVIAVTEIKHKNKWNLLNSELNIEVHNLYSNDLTGYDHGPWGCSLCFTYSAAIMLFYS